MFSTVGMAGRGQGGGGQGEEANRILHCPRGHGAFLALLLVWMALYRLCLGWTGQLYWPDEYRYLHAIHVLDELRKGDIGQVLYWIFGAEAGVASRPSYILFSLLPAVIQGLANLVFGVQPTDAVFYRIPMVANVAVSLGLTGAIYYIVWIISKDRLLAWVGASVHGLLANTNMYVRHLFPYDTSLFLFLLSVAILLNRPGGSLRPLVRAGLAGLLSGAAATTYPGYYLFLLVPLAVFLANRPFDWRALVVFGAAIAAVVAFWEGTARMGGFSFITASQHFSATFAPENQEGVQGAYEEGFRFLPMYLIEIEGSAGVALGLLFVAFTVMAVQGRFERLPTVMVAAAVVAYLAYAVTVQEFHRAVFYGRLVHMYLPIVVLAAMLAIKQIRLPVVRYGVIGLLLAVSAWSFAPMAATALAIRFPKDLERELTATAGPGAKICALGQKLEHTREEPQWTCDVLLENARHLYPLPVAWKTEPPNGFLLARKFPHPLQFPPYWFEGYSPGERERLATNPPVISVFTRFGRLPGEMG